MNFDIGFSARELSRRLFEELLGDPERREEEERRVAMVKRRRALLELRKGNLHPDVSENIAPLTAQEYQMHRAWKASLSADERRYLQIAAELPREERTFILPRYAALPYLYSHFGRSEMMVCPIYHFELDNERERKEAERRKWIEQTLKSGGCTTGDAFHRFEGKGIADHANHALQRHRANALSSRRPPRSGLKKAHRSKPATPSC